MSVRTGEVLTSESGQRYLVTGSQHGLSPHFPAVHYELVPMPEGATPDDFGRTFFREADLEAMDVASSVPS